MKCTTTRLYPARVTSVSVFESVQKAIGAIFSMIGNVLYAPKPSKFLVMLQSGISLVDLECVQSIISCISLF